MKLKKRIVLAYSGGLDTSIILKWLQENYKAEVICYTADIGQKINKKKIISNAKKLGVKKIIIKDLKNVFVKDYVFPIHSDSRDKLLSVVIYIAPEVNEGTWLYEDKSGKNPKQVEWIPNRAFVFSRNDNTWHSYRADGKNNRLTLVYNLRSDKYWKK